MIESVSYRSMEALSIVLVEDNPDHAELITDLLDEFYIATSVEHCKNGEDLMDHLNELIACEYGLPDIILLDLKMPRMGGREALKKLNQNAILKTIPVLVLSTSANQSEIDECYRLGAQGFITKPLNLAMLESKIKALYQA